MKDLPEGHKSIADWLDGVDPDCFSSESLDTSSHLFWNKGQAMDYGFHRTKYYSAAKVLAFTAKMMEGQAGEMAALAKALNSLYKSPFGQGDYEAAKQALANAGY